MLVRSRASLPKMLPVVAALGALFAAVSASAQFQGQTISQSFSDYGQTNGQAGPRQALFFESARNLFAARQTPYVDVNGNPTVVPAGYAVPCAGAGYGPVPCDDECEGYGPYGGYGGYGGHGGHMQNPYRFNGPMPMGAGGTAPPIGYELANDVGMEGFLVDQRGPHYFDARGEVVYMRPDKTFGQDIAITSFNVTDDNIVNSTGMLDYDYEAGFRIIGRYDLGPLSVLEFGYTGIYDWKSRHSFTDPNPADPDTGNLYSLFSNFGLDPPTVINPDGPAPQSERSITQSIQIDSDLQTAEISFRRYWVGYIPRVSGTLLAGFRYTKLKEDFEFRARGEASMRNQTRADNDLAGFQAGADMWIGLMQGVRIGAEGKAGLYNNHYTLDNVITTNPVVAGPPTLNERFADNEAAFISEASADIVFDVLPSWSIRAGYEILYLNSIVLAGENFNTGSPYGLPGQPPRVPFVNEQGHNFYHGGHVGLEFIW